MGCSRGGSRRRGHRKPPATFRPCDTRARMSRLAAARPPRRGGLCSILGERASIQWDQGCRTCGAGAARACAAPRARGVSGGPANAVRRRGFRAWAARWRSRAPRSRAAPETCRNARGQEAPDPPCVPSPARPPRPGKGGRMACGFRGDRSRRFLPRIRRRPPGVNARAKVLLHDIRSARAGSLRRGHHPEHRRPRRLHGGPRGIRHPLEPRGGACHRLRRGRGGGAARGHADGERRLRRGLRAGAAAGGAGRAAGGGARVEAQGRRHLPRGRADHRHPRRARRPAGLRRRAPRRGRRRRPRRLAGRVLLPAAGLVLRPAPRRRRLLRRRSPLRPGQRRLGKARRRGPRRARRHLPAAAGGPRGPPPRARRLPPGLPRRDAAAGRGPGPAGSAPS